MERKNEKKFNKYIFVHNLPRAGLILFFNVNL